MTKVIIALLGELSTEPDIKECFKAGYDSMGGDFNLTTNLRLEVNIDYGAPFINILEYAKNNGYSMVMKNGPATDDETVKAAKYYNSGILCVVPAGSNNYQDLVTNQLTHMIKAGAGETYNQTGYKVDFFDRDPFYKSGNITAISQVNETINITQVRRATSTTAEIKLNVASINSNTHIGTFDIITIAGLTVPGGISPVPNGTYEVQSVNGDFLTIIHNSSSGNSSFHNASAGTVTGQPQILITCSTIGLFLERAWIKLAGITGVSNAASINGMRRIARGATKYPFYDKITIYGTMGTGSYTSGGTFRQDFSSYSTPYIAGKMAYFKDTIERRENRKCSWWEVRHKFMRTASSNGVYDTYSGWGIPDIQKALNLNNEIPIDPYDTLGTEEPVLEQTLIGKTVYLKMNPVTNAVGYRLYNKTEIVQDTPTAGSLLLMSTPPRFKHEGPYEFHYRAYRGDQVSKKSNTITYKNYKFPKIIIAA